MKDLLRSTPDQLLCTSQCASRNRGGPPDAGWTTTAQVGCRGVWHIGNHDLEDFIAEAYRRTAEHISTGELKDDGAVH